MIEVYSWATPNGHKVHIMLEECALPYRVHAVDIGAGEQFAPEFLAISPNNKIPAIIDADGPDGQPIPLFESGAILLYLAAKTGRLLPADTRGRYEVLQWLMFQMAGVGPMLGQAHHFRQYAPEKIPYAIERYSNEAQTWSGLQPILGSQKCRGVWSSYCRENTGGGIPDNRITALAVDSLNQLWAGTYRGYLLKYDGREWFSYAPDSANGKLPRLPILGLAIDASGNKWLGFQASEEPGSDGYRGGGIMKFDGSMWTNFTSTKTISAMPGGNIVDVETDHRNHKWFAIAGGVTRYVGK